MPELAEVAYFARQWDTAHGQPIVSVHVNPRSRVFRGVKVSALADALIGAKLRGSRTHGKQMLFEFSGGHWLAVHLGMTGDLRTEPQPYEPARHDHLVLHTRRLALVFTDPRQFGAVKYYESKTLPASWRALPPQVLDDAFTADLVARALHRHARVPLKALLLDQRHFPGIGNWMADEVLWQAKIPPHILSGALDQKHAQLIWRTLRKVCTISLKTIGTAWTDPPRAWLFLHRWEAGGHCPRCGTALQRETLRGRTACWCPHCQAARLR